nr:ribonuclease H-like domain-containing protein [Tanacetum cinerariifolium]
MERPILFVYLTLWMIRRIHLNRGIIADLDADRDVTLEEVKVEKNAEVEKNEDVQGRLEESQAQVFHIDLEHADKVLITAAATFVATTITAALTAARRRKGVVIRDPEETATPSTLVHSEPKSKDKGKGILVEDPKPLKKQAQIVKDEAYDRELDAELNKNINWDDVIEQVKRKGKQDNAVLRYQALKRKPQIEAQARKNMMVYLKNMVGFKMDYFKGMSYDVIHPIFKKYFNSNVDFLKKSKEQLEEEESRALKRQSKSSEQQAAKKQKLDEEVEELKKHLQIVQNNEYDVYTEATPLALKIVTNDEDDVYTEATPLARKVPVVDYEIYTENNKPYYKIIRADESPQLFLSFLSLLRNFDREDLEVSDNKDCLVESPVVVEKKTDVHTIAKVKFVRPKQQEKTVRKLVRNLIEDMLPLGKEKMVAELLDLKFNLLSVSQMYDKKKSVLFTDTRCFVLSPNFKLADESQVLLKVPRKNNMKNIVPKESLTCLVSKATLDESMLWHKRLGHINFKNINKLVKDNLVRGRNRTLIEVARTMLADFKLPTTFLAEAVNTACYVQNRALVVKPHNKTPYELFRGTNSDDFASTKDSIVAGQSNMETGSTQDCIFMPLWKDGSPLFDSSLKLSDDAGSPSSGDAGKKHDEVLDK